VAKQPGDPAGRHPQPLAEPGRQRHRPGTKLGPRRSERVGGLLGMARLHSLAARAADVHAGNPTVTTWSTCSGGRRWARVP
jgi:hypothetical protein